MVDMVSPDEKVDIRLGDYRIPSFAPLTPALRNLGFAEGRLYNPRNVAQEMVANYRPGWVFADVYGQSRFSGACSQLRLKSMERETPVHQNGLNQTTTAGQVLYSCESNSGPEVAYVFAETQFDRALRGVDLTTDPVDGKEREVLSTGTTHWINGLDQIIDSPTAPGGNVRKLPTKP